MMTRFCCYVFLALLLPSAAWAHTRGPQTLEVKKGDTVEWGLNGSDFIEFQIAEKGDPLVAKIVPPMKNDERDVLFKIVGAGSGVTNFKINWDGSSRRGTCYIEVNVKE
jgi:hypothetical protein